MKKRLKNVKNGTKLYLRSKRSFLIVYMFLDALAQIELGIISLILLLLTGSRLVGQFNIIGADKTKRNTRQIIQSDGNVGIGGDDPSEKLEVAGNITPGKDNIYELGTPSLRWDNVFATNGTIQISDQRLKTDIVKLTYGLNQVAKMNPVHFQWKNDTSRKKNGFIAQEMMQIIPEVVNIGKDSLKTLG